MHVIWVRYYTSSSPLEAPQLQACSCNWSNPYWGRALVPTQDTSLVCRGPEGAPGALVSQSGQTCCENTVCWIEAKRFSGNRTRGVNDVGVLLLYLLEELHKVISQIDSELRGRCTIFLKDGCRCSFARASWRCRGRELYSSSEMANFSVLGSEYRWLLRVSTPEGHSSLRIEPLTHSLYTKAKRPPASVISLSSVPIDLRPFLMLADFEENFSTLYFACRSLYLMASLWWLSWASLRTWRWWWHECEAIMSSESDAPFAAHQCLAMKLIVEWLVVRCQWKCLTNQTRHHWNRQILQRTLWTW